MKTHFSVVILCCLLSSASAQVPTWAEDVQCILYTHCATCHNDNGIGPFSIEKVETVKALAPLIVAKTQAREMPPWYPNPEHNRFVGERLMTDQEIEIIRRWYLNEMPIGDTLSNSLSMPDFDGYHIPDPDYTIRMQKYDIPDAGKDIVQCFPVASGLDTTVYVTEAEYVPGDRETVHHAFANIDGSGLPFLLDSLYPGPGYDCYGGTGTPSSVLMGYAPGTPAIKLPPGVGIKIPAGSNMLFSIHYAVNAALKKDSSQIRLKITTESLREAKTQPLLHHNEDVIKRPFFGVRKNKIDTIWLRSKAQKDITLWGIGVHAHQICTDLSVMAAYPDGTIGILIDNPNWNPWWQAVYQYKKPMIIPRGTVLLMRGIYDNTVDNPRQVHFPPKNLGSANSQLAEMEIALFLYSDYESGDELIVIDSTEQVPYYNDCSPDVLMVRESDFGDSYIYPNPSAGEFTLNLIGQFGEGVREMEVVDLAGRLIYKTQLHEKSNLVSLPEEIPNGVYVCQIIGQNGNISQSRKITIVR